MLQQQSNIYTSLDLGKINSQILSALPYQVAILNDEGTVVAHNKLWLDHTILDHGYSSFPKLGENILQKLQNPLVNRNEFALQIIVACKAVLSGENDTREVVYQQVSSNDQWFRLKITSMEGKKHFLLTNEEITREILSKKAATEHQKKYQKQFQNKFYGILIADTDHNVIDLNETACKQLGYSKSEALDLKLCDLLDLKVLIDEDNPGNSFSEIYFGEAEFTKDDDTKMPAEISITQQSNHMGETFIHCTFRDLSERIQVNKKLTEIIAEKDRTELFYRQLFDSTANGVVVLDKEGNIIDLNSSFEKIFGYSKTELVGNPLFKYLSPEDDYEAHQLFLQQVLAGSEINIETTRRAKDKRAIPVLLSKFPIKIEGEVVAAFCVYVDMTEHVLNRNIITKQLKEKEVLIQEVHHRVKNNLAIISGLISLENMYNKNEELKKHLSLTQSRIHSIAKIHELLYSHSDFSSVDFMDYVDDMAKSLTTTSGFNFTTVPGNHISMNVNQAVPCGMLLNEISTTAAKKAAEQGLRTLDIQLSISVENEEFCMMICDMNKTSVFDFINTQEDQLTSELIGVLVRQLNGKLKLIEQNEYNCISITFRKKEKKGAHSAYLLN